MPHTELWALFQNHFGHAPEMTAVAPGRINLIGEHTDYNDGFVFPVAIDRGLYVAARRVDGPSRLYSRQAREGEPFDTATVGPGQIRGWARYPAGVAWALRQRGKDVPNIEALIDSQIPMGSGVSSSAALELAFGVVWNAMARLGLPNEALAHVGRFCENEFVGVNCGIMDQMASAMGREGYAMFLDTRSLEIQYAPIPPGISIVLCDTKKPRSLSGSAYNERRAECEEASRILGVEKLRDADMPRLLAARSQMRDVVFRRARHIISENDRCVRFRDALQQANLEEAGRLMRASHESLRDDYEVSCAELDAMADAAAASRGCIGARMTGAGFGGACVALVRTELLDAFGASVLAIYEGKTGIQGEATACRAVDGARVLVPG